MTLTPADVTILTRRFAANEHEVREGGKSRDKSKAMWLPYVEEEAIIERLNEVDPAWSLDVTRTERADGYIACYGTLTIKGVSRSGVGTNSPNRSGDPLTENEEKGAATDMLKRLARLFGIGLYLKKAPRIWLAADMKPWEAKDQAIQKLTAWLNQDHQERQQLQAQTRNPAKYPEWLDEDTTRDYIEQWHKLYAPATLSVVAFSVQVLALAKPGAKRYADLVNVIGADTLEEKVKANFEPEPPTPTPTDTPDSDDAQDDAPGDETDTINAPPADTKPTGIARLEAQQRREPTAIREAVEPHPLHNETVSLLTCRYDPARGGTPRWTATGRHDGQDVRVTIWREDIPLFERLGYAGSLAMSPNEKLLPCRVVLRWEKRNGLRVDGAWIDDAYVSVENIRQAMRQQAAED